MSISQFSHSRPPCTEAPPTGFVIRSDGSVLKSADSSSYSDEWYAAWICMRKAGAFDDPVPENEDATHDPMPMKVDATKDPVPVKDEKEQLPEEPKMAKKQPPTEPKMGKKGNKGKK
ncbi:unnamed protein product [Durusdinium trenchii]|uniref:Uncharacterized protein n=1 Tax=Durusdinium trenchii TaxID=1381693 RepID=A0ABP0JCV5_9DINO